MFSTGPHIPGILISGAASKMSLPVLGIPPERLVVTLSHGFTCSEGMESRQ